MSRRTQEKILREIRTIDALLPVNKRQVITLKNLSDAAVVRVEGELFSVVERLSYKEGRDSWFELKLFSLKDGRSCYLGYEEDDELELSLYDSFPKFKDLEIDLHDLDYFDDREEGSFLFDGTTFEYEDSNKAKLFREGDSTGESFYYWEFEDDDEELFISIEKWGDDYEVSVGHEIEESDIEIISKR